MLKSSDLIPTTGESDGIRSASFSAFHTFYFMFRTGNAAPHTTHSLYGTNNSLITLFAFSYRIFSRIDSMYFQTCSTTRHVEKFFGGWFGNCRVKFRCYVIAIALRIRWISQFLNKDLRYGLVVELCL